MAIQLSKNGKSNYCGKKIDNPALLGYTIHSLEPTGANMMNDTLIPNANWQTQQRGDNDSEYQIYVAAAESLGWEVKSYDEWLNS